MNKETLISYIKDEDLLGQKTISELSDLVDEFPYFATAHTLLAMNLRMEDHFKSDSVLKRTAVYAPDRSLLRDHIENLSATEQPVFLPDEGVEVPGAVKDEEATTEEYVAEAVVEEEESETSGSPVNVELTESVQENQETKDSHAFDENYEIEEDAKDETNLAEQEVTKPVSSVEDIDESEKEEEDALVDLRRIVRNRLRQIELEKLKKDQPVSVKKEEEKPVKKKNETRSVNELIDKFIKTEPSITRKQSAFFDPVDAARYSVTDDENIVSETLAEIYFDQRKFEKAISVYKKLSLKFPEKSSYFAARIEKAVEELKK